MLRFGTPRELSFIAKMYLDKDISLSKLEFIEV